MIGILALGFVVGIKHAFEADHLVAVATLATRARTLKAAVAQGVFWGVGHTIALLVVAGTVSLLGLTISSTTASRFELVVGVMLIVLAVDVTRRLVRGDLHLHVHAHDEGTRHLHAHGHHDHHGHGHDGPGGHHHHHPRGLHLRALLVGSVHGMAGSAALALLAVQAVQSVALAIVYIALFGLGSVAGMALLSVALATPLRWSARRLDRTYKALCLAAALLSLVVGLSVIVHNA